MNEVNKLWVFQSNKSLNEAEEQDITVMVKTFLESWAAHGDALKSKYEILDHKFIVISVDENYTKASGCSMDSLNQLMRSINAKYDLDLLNRLLVSYEQPEGEIHTINMNRFKEMVKNKELNSQSLVYNLSVSSSEEFKDKFKKPLAESWAKIYLN